MSSTDTQDLSLLARKEIERALRDIQFGTIEITLHEGRITQVERREKKRFVTEGPSKSSQRVKVVA